MHIPVLAIGILFCFSSATKVEAQEDRSRIAGVWRGNSECARKGGPCHDEINVYRFSDVAGKPGWFSVAGSKVVDGREVAMGVLAWKYDPDKRSLQSEDGAFQFTIAGDTMDGTLTLPDKTVYRRIHLRREK